MVSEKGKRLRGKGMDAFESGFKEIEREVSGIYESSHQIRLADYMTIIG